jgi:dihydroorotate dehydrogenase
MYTIIRALLFLFPPEWVHHTSMNLLQWLCRASFICKLISKRYNSFSATTATHGFGLHFKNHVGLAAGFDKNANYLQALSALGFGHIEIGTVTPLPQAGNDKPRLFRLPKDKALINRMGFNNDGVETIAARLKAWKEAEQKKQVLANPVPRLIVGGNIGKNKNTPNEYAWKDYVLCFNALFEVVDYFVINVSSPNTPGLRALQEKESLKIIITQLQLLNQHKPTPKPLLLKISPDLTTAQIDDVIDLALATKLDGLVVSNTTISKEGLLTAAEKVSAIGAGGLSGLPLLQKSTALLQYIANETKGQIPLIASGGIIDAEAAQAKMQAGASLLQLYTGFIYEGPGLVKKIEALLGKG